MELHIPEDRVVTDCSIGSASTNDGINRIFIAFEEASLGTFWICKIRMQFVVFVLTFFKNRSD